MTEPVNAVLLEPGETVPADTPPGTRIYVRAEGAMLDDGCLGQHYPETNEACTAKPGL